MFASEPWSILAVEVPQDLKDAVEVSGVSGWDVLVALAIVFLAIPVARGVDRWTRRFVQRVPNMHSDTVVVIGHVARYGVYFAAWSWSLNLVGVDVGWALAVAVVFLIIIVLALRPLIQNSAAGLLLQARPAFGIGDTIKVGDFTGEITDINARTTVLRSRDGVHMHLSNTDVLNSPATIYTAESSRRVSIEMGIDPEADLDEATEVLIEAVSGVESVVSDPAPRVRARSFGDGSIDVSVQFWFGPDTSSDVAVVDGAVRALNEAVVKAGIGMPPPEMTIHTPTPPPGSSA